MSADNQLHQHFFEAHAGAFPKTLLIGLLKRLQIHSSTCINIRIKAFTKAKITPKMTNVAIIAVVNPAISNTQPIVGDFLPYRSHIFKQI